MKNVKRYSVYATFLVPGYKSSGIPLLVSRHSWYVVAFLWARQLRKLYRDYSYEVVDARTERAMLAARPEVP